MRAKEEHIVATRVSFGIFVQRRFFGGFGFWFLSYEGFMGLIGITLAASMSLIKM